MSPSLRAGEAVQQPINQLPNEILVEIFIYVQMKASFAARFHRRSQRRPWYRILHVCKHWAAVARASPVLWRIINLAYKPDLALLQYSLAYSGDMALEISVYNNTEPFGPFTNMISPHTHRIRALKLDYADRLNDYALSSLLYHRMATLEQLHISFSSEAHDGDDELNTLIPEQTEDEEGNPVRYPFFWFPTAGQFPNIVQLSLGSCVAFSLRMPVFPTLKRLELRFCTVLGDVSLQDFLAYVRMHPVLEELDLGRLNLSNSGAADLKLPSTLRKFTLSHFPTIIAAFLLALTPIPADVNIHLIRRLRYIEPDFEPELPVSAIGAFPQDRLTLPILKLVDTIILRQTHWEYYSLLGRTPHGEMFGLTGWVPENPQEPMRLLNDLRDAFQDAPVTVLRVEGHDYHKLPVEDWVHILDHFSGLSSIGVLDTVEEPDSDARSTLFKALQSRTGDLASENGVICPRLSLLQIKVADPDQDTRVASEMADCLRHRASLGHRLTELHIFLHPLPSWKATSERPVVDVQERVDTYTKAVQSLVGTLRLERGGGPTIVKDDMFYQIW